MGILAKEIEHKLTQILLDCRKEVLRNKNGKTGDWLYGELILAIENFEYAWILQNDDRKKYSTKLIALLIQYQLKYL